MAGREDALAAPTSTRSEAPPLGQPLGPRSRDLAASDPLAAHPGLISGAYALDLPFTAIPQSAARPFGRTVEEMRA